MFNLIEVFKRSVMDHCISLHGLFEMPGNASRGRNDSRVVQRKCRTKNVRYKVL